MSASIATTACSVSEAPRRKRVQFRSMCQVKEGMHEYPSDYFYTKADYARFRKEAREERMGSAISPVQRAFDIASSSLATVVLLIVGLVAATIACLPILLLLKLASLVFSGAAQEGIDSSLRPYFPSTERETTSLTDRLLFSVLGHSSLSCSGNGSSQCETQFVSPLLSN